MAKPLYSCYCEYEVVDFSMVKVSLLELLAHYPKFC